MSIVLAAVDDSAASRPVVAVATVLATVLTATVEAAHVAEEGGATMQGSAEEFGVPLRVVGGDPLEELKLLIADDNVVAVAIGTRGMPGHHRPVGHLALGVVDSTDKPVLVVPPESRIPERLRNVLVAMEGSASRPRRMKRALAFVSDTGLEVTIVHVDEPEAIPSFSDQVQHETDAYTDAFLGRYCGGIRPSHFELRIGQPEEEIVDAAVSLGVDLVAMGWPAGEGPEHGHIAREVLRLTELPTLLVAVEELVS
jgi:nucleotide-binding universal stress UspA family protein